MNSGKEFDDILDECLERLLVKSETIEQCLASHPEQAAELKSLLETAVVARKSVTIEPRPEFRARARYQLLSALAEPKPRRWQSFFLGWKPQWTTAVAIVLVLLLAGGGTVAAARSSMPGSTLYPVKLATEQVQLALTFPSLGKTELYARLADRRVTEIVYMVDTGNTEQIEPTAQRLDSLLVTLASLPLAEEAGGRVLLAPEQAVAPPPKPVEETDKGIYGQATERDKLRTLLRNYAVKHPAELQAVLEIAPESAKPTLRRLIIDSESSYQQALSALE